MRAIDLDMTGRVWLYRPGSDQGPEGTHKTAYRGHQRIIALGPRAQEVIKPFLRLDTRAYLFSPREAMETLWEEKRRERKSKVPPSQVCRKKARPQRQAHDRYTVSSYGKAILRGCDKADAAAHEQDKSIPPEHRVVPHWHPHQLRHAAATAIRREYGLDVARVVLGHRSPQITELYAELDVNRAAEVMAKLG
jgi:integrase